jgi:Putative auto-transporter adhesin, head GIN domain
VLSAPKWVVCPGSGHLTLPPRQAGAGAKHGAVWQARNAGQDAVASDSWSARTAEGRVMAITSAPHHGSHSAHRSQLALIAAWTAAVILVGIGLAMLVHGGGSSGSGVQGWGIAATQTRTVAGFSSLDLAGSHNVTVMLGARQSVVVHADSNVIGHVTTKVVAGTLVIADTGSFTMRQEPSLA